MSKAQVLDRPRTDQQGPKQALMNTTNVTNMAALREFVAKQVERKPRLCFSAMYFAIEEVEEETLRAIKLGGDTGTAMAALNDAIASSGISGATDKLDGTIGGVMNALNLTRDDMHALVCHCHGQTITGGTLASRLRGLKSA